MPVELLKAIANKPLPLTITDPNDIDKLRVLRAAGYMTVLLPSPGGDQRFARVLHITAKGRAAVLHTRSDRLSQHQTAHSDSLSSRARTQARPAA
jgi:hypothetical protein